MEVTARLNGTDSLDLLIREISGQVCIMQNDLIFAMTRQAERIIDRTIMGVDYNDQPFKPYDTEHPYYYYPAGHALKRTLKKNTGKIKALFPRGGGTSTKGGGLRFESYAAFKKALGRTGVDLRGPETPRMMDSIQLTSEGSRLSFNHALGAIRSANKATKVTLGIYDKEKAVLAEAHNLGISPMPQRQFMGFSESDVELILNDVTKGMQERLSR